MTAKITLYTMPGACSLADHIALHWVGVTFDVVKLDHAAIKQPEFLAINPAGAVPVLKVGEWVLTQNMAILNYIADRFPDAKLGGDGTPQSRAEVNRWLALLNADLHTSFPPLFGATAYLGEDVANKTKEIAKARIRSLFERLDAQLTGRVWLTGERSIADPYLFVVMRWAFGMKIDLSDLSNLNAFFTRMSTDAGVQAAMAAEGLQR